jgi:uncharacterized repeat protein (TIGR01451 family)
VNPYGIAVGEFNGDGKADIAVANVTSNNMTVYLGGANLTTPALSVVKTHQGSFSQAQQNATYTVAVSNAANAIATSGTVTLTETLPAGVTLASMAGGTDWTCPPGGTTCTTNVVLGAGASYSPITVTVNVNANAPASLTNQVSVSGGGSATALASDLTSVSGLCDVTKDGATTIADVQALINQALGKTLAANDLNQDGMVDVVDVEIAMKAVMGLGCAAR